MDQAQSSYMSQFKEQPVTTKKSFVPYFLKTFVTQGIIVFFLFLSLYAMLKSDHPLARKGQAMLSTILADRIQIETITAWYDKLFAGAPSLIPVFSTTTHTLKVPVVAPLPDAEIIASFIKTNQAIQLKVPSASAVVAVQAGQVVDVTQNNDEGVTITLRHANKLETVYSHMAETTLNINDWVEAGDQVGRVEEVLHFALLKAGSYINPESMIPFD